MKQRILYIIWAVLFLLCGLLGKVTQAQGIIKVALSTIAVLFFVPGLLLLLDGLQRKDRKAVSCIRWICIASLGLTLLMLIVNLASFDLSVAAGNVLYDILVFVSSPMVCSQYWVLSLFLWACLLMGTFYKPTPDPDPRGRK